MARHGSASARKEALPRKEISRRNETLVDKEASPSEEKSHEIDASLKRRARLLMCNSSIPSQTRALIRYGLQMRDPHLAQVVRRVEAGEMIIEWLDVE